MIKNNDFDSFFQEHLPKADRTLFIMGKGFDSRMNLAIKKIQSLQIETDIDCLVIEYDQGKTSSASNYKQLVESNYQTLKNLFGENQISTKTIKMWEGKGRNKRKIASRQASDNIISTFDDIKEYNTVIVDISSIPRSIYFSLIGKIMYLIDKDSSTIKKNFIVIVAENSELDSNIQGKEVESDLDYSRGFGGGLDLSHDSPVIWLPILGENKNAHIDKAFRFIDPDELCPILPFPSKNPRRGDNMIIEYHKLLFEELLVEPQNIMYVSEQNPFDTYRKICSTISRYKESMQSLGDCRAAISTFSSKLLSIGALLAAYDLNHPINEEPKIGVGVVNVDSPDYEILDLNSLEESAIESELFVIWLTGEPYHE